MRGRITLLPARSPAETFATLAREPPMNSSVLAEKSARHFETAGRNQAWRWSSAGRSCGLRLLPFYIRDSRQHNQWRMKCESISRLANLSLYMAQDRRFGTKYQGTVFGSLRRPGPSARLRRWHRTAFRIYWRISCSGNNSPCSNAGNLRPTRPTERLPRKAYPDENQAEHGTESYQINDWKSCCKLLILQSAGAMARDNILLILRTPSKRHSGMTFQKFSTQPICAHSSCNGTVK